MAISIVSARMHPASLLRWSVFLHSAPLPWHWQHVVLIKRSRRRPLQPSLQSKRCLKALRLWTELLLNILRVNQSCAFTELKFLLGVRFPCILTPPQWWCTCKAWGRVLYSTLGYSLTVLKSKLFSSRERHLLKAQMSLITLRMSVTNQQLFGWQWLLPKEYPQQSSLTNELDLRQFVLGTVTAVKGLSLLRGRPEFPLEINALIQAKRLYKASFGLPRWEY